MRREDKEVAAALKAHRQTRAEAAALDSPRAHRRRPSRPIRLFLFCYLSSDVTLPLVPPTSRSQAATLPGPLFLFLRRWTCVPVVVLPCFGFGPIIS
ncbi:hypothetical protein DFH06DRAFT_1184700 [Mycena polygramma]|nr:hypothetical protein DFH06DRAFT_1184700 [Mycena polygramma]